MGWKKRRLWENFGLSDARQQLSLMPQFPLISDILHPRGDKYEGNATISEVLALMWSRLCTNVSEGSPEKQDQCLHMDTHLYEEICHRSRDYEGQEVPWRTWKVGCIIQSEFKGLRTNSSMSEGRRRWMFQLKERKHSSFLHLFVPCRPSADCMMHQ